MTTKYLFMIAFVLFVSGNIVGMDKDFVIREWRQNDILIQAKIHSQNKDISTGLFFYLNITNNSHDDIRIMFDSCHKPESFLLCDIYNTTSKLSLPLKYPKKQAATLSYGKLSFLFIKPGSTCSMKVNLLDRFLIKNHQSYSLELKGFIYLDNGKGLEFIIPQLNFFVE